MTDCEHVREILDAYAIGAAETADARAIEEHVADCVRCWEELSKARQTAALLALTSPMSKAPAALEGRIVDAAARERR
ncbi:MAG TPA: zf-HC2 domain-containing protein, partial [Dehalococcoidia bacterium]|nr:zf-HC2 domain-containing protein [Dehalococcoidia bacterium]